MSSDSPELLGRCSLSAPPGGALPLQANHAQLARTWAVALTSRSCCMFSRDPFSAGAPRPVRPFCLRFSLTRAPRVRRIRSDTTNPLLEATLRTCCMCRLGARSANLALDSPNKRSWPIASSFRGPAALLAVLACNLPNTFDAEALQSSLIAALAQPTCKLPQLAFGHADNLNCFSYTVKPYRDGAEPEAGSLRR